MTLLLGGNVGIGTTAPQSKLEVNGSMNVNGNVDIGLFNITASWFNGNLSWTRLANFPVACPAGTYVTQISGSTTCTSVTNDYNHTLATIPFINTASTNLQSNITAVNTSLITYTNSNFYNKSANINNGYYNTTKNNNTYTYYGDGNQAYINYNGSTLIIKVS
jgi:hypothetical protein